MGHGFSCSPAIMRNVSVAPHRISQASHQNNGVMQLVENPGDSGGPNRRKVLVYLPTSQVVASYSGLEKILRELGWERYYLGDPDRLQFHKPASNDLISLPRQFARFSTVHMYDIVVKNPNVFHVRDNY